MNLKSFLDFFIHPRYFQDSGKLRKARLFVRASLLTSVFSNTYVLLSHYFEFQAGVYFMVFNGLGFILLPFLLKTKIPYLVVSNLYVLVGALAVICLPFYSGGIASGVYPWIVTVPVLALLVTDRKSAIVWAVISYISMNTIGLLALNGVEFTNQISEEKYRLWYVTIVPGILLIIFIISLVFEGMYRKGVAILERKNCELEEQKETIAEQSTNLKLLIEDKKHLIRLMAHDIKNPLSNIIMLSNLLKMDGSVKDQERILGLIDETTSNAMNLVKKVLYLDAKEFDKKETKEKINLDHVLSVVVESMQLAASKKDITIEFIEQSEQSSVLGDPIYLHLIIENLLSNAVKFSPRSSQITVRVHRTDSRVSILVSDQGPGISEEDQKLLFKEFQTLSSRPTGGESSSGLGLMLVKRYVEEMNGIVKYDNEIAIGATFIVELPAA